MSVRLAKVVDCIVLLRACVMQCVSDDQPTVFEGTSVLASALQSHCDTKYVKKKFFRFRAGVYFPAGCVFFSAMLPALSWSLVVVDSIAVLSTALFLFYCSTNGLLDLKTLWFGFQGEWRWTFGNLRNGRQTAVPRMFHHAFNGAISLFLSLIITTFVGCSRPFHGVLKMLPVCSSEGDLNLRLDVLRPHCGHLPVGKGWRWARTNLLPRWRSPLWRSQQWRSPI